jgi:hypothetical protein
MIVSVWSEVSRNWSVLLGPRLWCAVWDPPMEPVAGRRGGEQIRNTPYRDTAIILE